MSFSFGSFFRFLSDEELVNGFKIQSQVITLSVSDISKKSNQPVNFFQTVFFQVLFQGFTFKQSSDEKKKEAGVRLILK